MSYITDAELKSFGFKCLGINVKISRQCSIINPETLEIGDNSRIDDFCVISGQVSIGRNVHIAVFCNVAGGSEGVTFEDFSGLAYGCYVFSQSDDYSGRTLTNPTVPAKYKSETKAAVVIGRHCIVGTSSLIFPGVTLAEGSAVGAMSIYTGTPAKRRKPRKRDLLSLEKDYLAEQS